MKQTDSSLSFPLLMKALERCVFPAGLHYPYFIPFGKVRIKNTSISVIFWIFLLGKYINSVDPQVNTSSNQGLRQQ